MNKQFATVCTVTRLNLLITQGSLYEKLNIEKSKPILSLCKHFKI